MGSQTLTGSSTTAQRVRPPSDEPISSREEKNYGVQWSPWCIGGLNRGVDEGPSRGASSLAEPPETSSEAENRPERMGESTSDAKMLGMRKYTGSRRSEGFTYRHWSQPAIATDAAWKRHVAITTGTPGSRSLQVMAGKPGQMC